MTYRGKIEKGLLVIEEPIAFPEGTQVTVDIAPVQEAMEQGVSLYQRYKSIIGIAPDLPDDMAKNHDHYAHGAPKGIDSK
ncbi:MAG TPA: hypothetical protein VIL86_04655 [Tepidisphaeraceae bacterium]